MIISRKHWMGERTTQSRFPLPPKKPDITQNDGSEHAQYGRAVLQALSVSSCQDVLVETQTGTPKIKRTQSARSSYISIYPSGSKLGN